MKTPKQLMKIGIMLLVLQVVLGTSFCGVNQIRLTDAASPNLNLDVEHLIQIKEGGLVVINTLISIRNDGSDPINDLKNGFPREFEQNLEDVVAYDSQKLNVNREGVEGNVSWLKIEFRNALNPGETNEIRVTSVFSGLITFNQSGSPEYTTRFPECPILAFDADRCDIIIELPEGTIGQASSLSSLLNEVRAPLAAYSNKTGFIRFTGEIDILEWINLSSELRLGPWDRLSVYETFKMRNIGLNNIGEIVLSIPLEAVDISVYDSGGALKISINEREETKEVLTDLRYPLRGVENSVHYYETCSFTVSYRLISRKVISLTDSWKNYRFELRLPLQLNLTVKNREIRVLLPEGAKYESSSYSGDISTHGITQTITYGFADVSPLTVLEVRIDYEYLVFWAALRPMIWVGSIIAAISGLVLNKGKRKKRKTELSDKNIGLLKSFADVADERLLLWAELNTLEENLDRRRIKRKDYNRRKRTIQQRIRTLDNARNQLKSGIAQMGPHYVELMEKDASANGEFLALMDSMNRLRNQHRTGKLTRKTYQRFMENDKKKADDAKRIIESIIIELKSSS